MTSPDRARITLQSITGQALGLVPLFVGLLFGALVLPRGVPPEEVPLPTVDARELARIAAEDDARAARVESAPLGSRVRSVGTAFRAFNAAEAGHEDEATLAKARIAIVESVRALGATEEEALKDLRAYQMRSFLVEVARYEGTGLVSDDLRELGGTFIDRMVAVGWCPHHHVAMPDAARRAAFKLTWNHTVIPEGASAFALTIDETRALYSFYLRHPHAGQAERQRLLATIGERDPLTRSRAEEAARKASATWLLVKVNELSKLDPSYPAPLARAAALYMNREYRASASLYQSWLEAHPDGPWTLRAQNHLRAAFLAEDLK
jgi:hypothetical protein